MFSFQFLHRKILVFVLCFTFTQASIITNAYAFGPCASPSWEEFNQFEKKESATDKIKSFASSMRSYLSAPKKSDTSNALTQAQIQAAFEEDRIREQAEEEHRRDQLNAARRQAQLEAQEKAEKKRKFWEAMGAVAQIAGAVAGVVVESKNQGNSPSTYNPKRSNCGHHTCSIPGE